MKVVAVAAAVAALVGAGAASAAEVSSNWAGYAITATNATTGAPSTFTTVTGSWIQPRARCSAGHETYSAFWVGLGGYDESSEALEQIGTSSDCAANGKPSYSMWWEIVPAPSVPVKLKVFPGNAITATVTVTGTTTIVRLDNLTRHTFFQKRLTVANPDLTSAEWVAEAPSTCSGFGRCSVLPLANFGNVAFSHVSATGDGHVGTIVDPLWTPSEIWLVPSNARRFFGVDSSPAGAAPAGLTPDGAAFSVAYRATAALPPEPAPTPVETPPTQAP